MTTDSSIINRAKSLSLFFGQKYNSRTKYGCHNTEHWNLKSMNNNNIDREIEDTVRLNDFIL